MLPATARSNTRKIPAPCCDTHSQRRNFPKLAGLAERGRECDLFTVSKDGDFNIATRSKVDDLRSKVRRSTGVRTVDGNDYVANFDASSLGCGSGTDSIDKRTGRSVSGRPGANPEECHLWFLSLIHI